MADNRELALKLFGGFRTTLNPFMLGDLRHAISKECYDAIFSIMHGSRENIIKIARKNINILEHEWIVKWGRFLFDRECMSTFEKVLRIVIDKDDPILACEWALRIGNRVDMRNIILKHGSPSAACRWAFLIEMDKKDMKEIVQNFGNAEHFHYWGRWIGNRKRMKREIMAAGDPEYAYKWARDIGDHSDMVEIVIESGSRHWARVWMFKIGYYDARITNLALGEEYEA